MYVHIFHDFDRCDEGSKGKFINTNFPFRIEIYPNFIKSTFDHTDKNEVAYINCTNNTDELT